MRRKLPKKCRDFAFENNYTYSDSLISIIDINNTKSASVAEKNGMTLDKITLWLDHKVKIFRISKEEWEQRINETA